jgi:hypothetical protein
MACMSLKCGFMDDCGLLFRIRCRFALHLGDTVEMGDRGLIDRTKGGIYSDFP